MRLGPPFIAAVFVCAITAGTLVAQELPTDTPNDEDNWPRIVTPDATTLLLSAPEDLVHSIRDDAGQRLGVDPASVVISTSQPVEWSDASLGCPREQLAYAQVITPGFLIVVEVGGNRLNYHTDANGRFVLCDGPPNPAIGVGI